MDRTGRRIDDPVRDTLEAELGIIREAILLVAAGHSPRVVVAGLRLGEALLRPAQELAAEHGVSVQPRWSADEAGASVAVVPASPSR